MSVDTNSIMSKVLGQYRLRIEGTHGMSHWSRVLRIGRYLAPLTGADQDVCDLFALLHDSQRVTEGPDDFHGIRGARYVASLLKYELKEYTHKQIDCLMYAIKHHNMGGTRSHDVTITTCWDMDRLDLGRVGYRPDPKKLCTHEGKKQSVIDWAYSASVINTLGPDENVLIPEKSTVYRF